MYVRMRLTAPSLAWRQDSPQANPGVGAARAALDAIVQQIAARAATHQVKGLTLIWGPFTSLLPTPSLPPGARPGCRCS